MPRSDSPHALYHLPTDFGALVREARQERKWTQARLARQVGVRRETISSLETGDLKKAAPSARLVRALLRDEAIGTQLPSIETQFPLSWQCDRGFRASAARQAAGTTLTDAASAAGISPASLSQFERTMATPKRIVGSAKTDDGISILNDAYARAIGFDDAADMSRYIGSDDPLAWLQRIAEAKKVRLPPARLPTRRILPPETENGLLI